MILCFLLISKHARKPLVRKLLYLLISKYYSNYEVKMMLRNTITSSKTTAISITIRLKNRKESNLDSFTPINLTATLSRVRRDFKRKNN